MAHGAQATRRSDEPRRRPPVGTARRRRAAGRTPSSGVVRLSAGTPPFSVIRTGAWYTPFAALRAAAPGPTGRTAQRSAFPCRHAIWTVGVPTRGCIFTANAHDRGGCTPRRHVTGCRLSLRCWACFGFFACLIDDSVGSGRGRCQLGALVPEQQTVPTDGFAPRSVSGSSVNAQQLEPHPRLGDGCVLIVRRFPLPPQTPTPRRKSHDRERHPEHHLRPRRRPGCPQDGP